MEQHIEELSKPPLNPTANVFSFFMFFNSIKIKLFDLTTASCATSVSKRQTQLR
jgi:hypothetical protein